MQHLKNFVLPLHIEKSSVLVALSSAKSSYHLSRFLCIPPCRHEWMLQHYPTTETECAALW